MCMSRRPVFGVGGQEDVMIEIAVELAAAGG
jgi:hypothetical protein